MLKFKNDPESRLEKSLDASIGEGATTAASTNMTVNYIVPFALFLGATGKDIGFLVVIQNLGMAISQIPGARLVGYASRKFIWTSTMIASRLLWMILPFAVLVPGNHFLWLSVILFSIFFLNGLRNPAWTSLMGDIVPPSMRGAYFGKRNMISGIAGLFAMMISGVILSYFGFGWLFLAAGAVGLSGIYFFLKVDDPGIKKRFVYRHTLDIRPERILRSMYVNPDFFWFTLYMTAASFAIAIASPFYAVKMLSDIGIGYIWYSVIITIEALVAIFSQPYWGRLSDRYGDKAMLAITGSMICSIPFVWIFANTIPLLVLVSIFGGFIFSGFTLVTFNFLLASVPAEKKAAYIANHSFLTGIGTIMGTFFGGLLAVIFASSRDAITIIFLFSFLTRISTLAILPHIRRGYHDTKEPLDRLAMRSLLIEPARTVYGFLGYAYDVKWMCRKTKEIMNSIFRKIIFRLRMETNGKV